MRRRVEERTVCPERVVRGERQGRTAKRHLGRPRSGDARTRRLPAPSSPARRRLPTATCAPRRRSALRAVGGHARTARSGQTRRSRRGRSRVTIEAESIDIELESRRIERPEQGQEQPAVRARTDRRRAARDRTPSCLDCSSRTAPSASRRRFGATTATAASRSIQDERGCRRATPRSAPSRSTLQQKAGDLTRAAESGRSSCSTTGDLGRRGRRAPVRGRGTHDDLHAHRPRGQLGSPTAHVTGPQGDLRGRRVTSFSARAESRLERLEAQDDVIARIDARTVAGHPELQRQGRVRTR